MTTEINERRLKRFIALVERREEGDWITAAKMPLSTDEFVELAKHDNSDVRLVIMWHPCAPIKVLAKGAQDENADVRDAAMKNPNTPVDALIEGAKDRDGDVRMAALDNPNMPIEVLYEGLEDNEPVVRLLAEQILRERETMAEMENIRKLDDEKCIYYFEEGFDNFDYLHTLASRHAKVPEGVLNYWAEKLEALVNDYELLRAEARLAPLFRKGR
jgi:hypothetical protein